MNASKSKWLAMLVACAALTAAATAATATTKKTSSWDKPDDKPNVPKVGYYDIDTSEYGGSMDVKNRGNEECFTTGEGIGKNGWAFGITAGKCAVT